MPPLQAGASGFHHGPLSLGTNSLSLSLAIRSAARTARGSAHECAGGHA